MTESIEWPRTANVFMDRAYFGRSEDDAGGADRSRWDRYIDRAYLDLCRTINYHGASNQEGAWRPERAAGNLAVASSLTQLADVRDRESFDDWHRCACSSLRKAFDGEEVTASRLTVGQAQKWINMAIKYLVVAEHLGLDVRFSASHRLFEHFHLPLDSISIKNFSEKFVHHDLVRQIEPWSKITKYDTYRKVQDVARGWNGGALAFDFNTW